MRVEEYRQPTATPESATPLRAPTRPSWLLLASSVACVLPLTIVGLVVVHSGGSRPAVQTLANPVQSLATPIVVIVAPAAPAPVVSATPPPSPAIATAMATVPPTPVGTTTTECTWHALPDGTTQQVCTQYGH
jgi:hypothetical protein